jgi:hypothetical protein
MMNENSRKKLNMRLRKNQNPKNRVDPSAGSGIGKDGDGKTGGITSSFEAKSQD